MRSLRPVPRPLAGALLAAALLAPGARALEKRLLFPERLGIKHHCPTVTELEDGSLLAAWYYGTTHHGESDVGGALLGAVLAGGEWSAPIVLYDSYRDAEGNPVLHYDTVSRKLHLFAGTMREDPRWDSLTTHWLSSPVRRAEEIDLGAFQPISWTLRGTWSRGAWRDVPPERGERGWVLRNRALVLGADLLLPMYRHGADPTVALLRMRRTTERWEAPVELPVHAAEQASLVRVADDEVLMLTRNTSPRGTGTKAWTSRSRDRGRTWDPLEPHPTLVNENNSLAALRLPDGRLFLARNTDRTRNELRYGVSADGGLRWEERTLERAANAEFSYPTVLLTRDGSTVHVLYSYYRRTIAHAAIPVGEL